MSDPVRVLVVDDHAVVRAGLRLLIDREPSMVVVDEAADANEAIFRVMEHKPDVLLIDVTLPGESGIHAIPKLLAASPDTKILVLSMHDDPRYVREAFAAGACAYVLKEAADAEVVAAIREVAAGGSYVNPVLGARMVAADAKEQAEARADPLSEREHEVLRLLALGHTNQEIAKSLYISVRTAETHRAHIMQKLGLTSRAELVRYALAKQILEPEGD
jgi:two-component system response regulator NreC